MSTYNDYDDQSLEIEGDFLPLEKYSLREIFTGTPCKKCHSFFCLVGIYTHHHVCKTWAACKFGSVRCSSTKKYFQMLNGNKDNKSETREET